MFILIQLSLKILYLGGTVIAQTQGIGQNLNIPIYINSTPDGIFSFNLNKIYPTFEVNNKNPATTQFYNNNRVEKEVTYLEINEALKL